MGLDGVREEAESVRQKRSAVGAGGACVVEGGLKGFVAGLAAGHAPVRAVDGGGWKEEEEEEEEEGMGENKCGHRERKRKRNRGFGTEWLSGKTQMTCYFPSFFYFLFIYIILFQISNFILFFIYL